MPSAGYSQPVSAACHRPCPHRGTWPLVPSWEEMGPRDASQMMGCQPNDWLTHRTSSEKTSFSLRNFSVTDREAGPLLIISITTQTSSKVCWVTQEALLAAGCHFCFKSCLSLKLYSRRGDPGQDLVNESCVSMINHCPVVLSAVPSPWKTPCSKKSLQTGWQTSDRHLHRCPQVTHQNYSNFQSPGQTQLLGRRRTEPYMRHFWDTFFLLREVLPKSPAAEAV